MKAHSHEELNRLRQVERTSGSARAPAATDLHRTDNGASIAWIDAAGVHQAVMVGRVNGGPLSICAMRGDVGPVLALGDDRARALRDALTELLKPS